MAIDQLSRFDADGTVLGQSATDKISFYGATPIVRAAAPAALTAAPTTAEFVAQGNGLRTALINLGLLT